MAEVAEELCDEYEARGLTGRSIFWRRDRTRLLDDLQQFLRADDARRAAHGLRPHAVELQFGFGENDAAPLPLPDGRELRFRGFADRLDVGDDGTLHVIDYKTGGTWAFEGLGDDDPDLRGRKLQLVVYGAAARLHAGRPDAPVRAEYWFVSRKGGFKRIGYDVTDDVFARVGRTVATLIGGIEAGLFPAHPTASSTSPFIECHTCNPDGLGEVELRRQWERKRHDPVVAPYADLAEPMQEAPA
jgi:RecB family exonuclease